METTKGQRHSTRSYGAGLEIAESVGALGSGKSYERVKNLISFLRLATHHGEEGALVTQLPRPFHPQVLAFPWGTEAGV